MLSQDFCKLSQDVSARNYASVTNESTYNYKQDAIYLTSVTDPDDNDKWLILSYNEKIARARDSYALVKDFLACAKSISAAVSEAEKKGRRFLDLFQTEADYLGRDCLPFAREQYAKIKDYYDAVEKNYQDIFVARKYTDFAAEDAKRAQRELEQNSKRLDYETNRVLEKLDAAQFVFEAVENVLTSNGISVEKIAGPDEPGSKR